MKSFRWLFITGGIVVVLTALAIAIGTAWLNSFIHSDAFRQQVEAQAGQTLGGTVQIQRIDFNPFTGVELRGLATQIDSNRIDGRGALVVKIESVRCTYSFRELLHRRLKLTGLTLEKPQVVLTRQPASVVAIVPPPAAPPPAPSDAAETGGATASGATSAAPAASGTVAPPPNGTLPSGAAPFQFTLEEAKVNDGTLSIRDAAGTSLAELTGVEVKTDTSGLEEGRDVTGDVKIADLALPSNIHITGLSTGFTYRTGALEVKPLEAAAFNGRLAGDYQSGALGPSILEINGKALDVGLIGSLVNPASPAKLTGLLDLQSKWQGIETGAVKGEGDAQLTNGKLDGVTVLQELADILRVKELRSPTLRKVQTHFQIDGGQTRFTGLQLDAGIFQMTGAGVIAADGRLDANMVLILSRDAMSRLPREAAVFFVQQPDGSASIAYHLGGTINHPQTDLATRIFLQNMKVQNVIKKALNRFFR